MLFWRKEKRQFTQGRRVYKSWTLYPSRSKDRGRNASNCRNARCTWPRWLDEFDDPKWRKSICAVEVMQKTIREPVDRQRNKMSQFTLGEISIMRIGSGDVTSKMSRSSDLPCWVVSSNHWTTLYTRPSTAQKEEEKQVFLYLKCYRSIDDGLLLYLFRRSRRCSACRRGIPGSWAFPPPKRRRQHRPCKRRALRFRAKRPRPSADDCGWNSRPCLFLKGQNDVDIINRSN